MATKTVLLIEDDSDMQKVYFEKLSSVGYSVLLAATGKEGLFMAKDKKPNLVLLDIMLPGEMNGFDLLEQLKSDPDLKKIPVIVITNLDSEKKVSMEIGAEDYLVKADTELNELVEKVKKHAK